MKVGESKKLSLSSLRTPQQESPNLGLNCTILLNPKPGFGLELRFTNLSIYGIRELCKERFLSFTLPQSPSEELNVKYCGKFEDYRTEERVVSFGGSVIRNGVILRLSLPNYLKPKETFSLDLLPISPCQKVLLSQLQGTLKYELSSSEEDAEGSNGASASASECSIVIHVPYGNTIETEIIFSNGPLFAHKPTAESDTESPITNSSRSQSTIQFSTIGNSSPPACNEESAHSTFEKDSNYLVVHVLDLLSSTKSFVDCIDGRVYSFHKTKWKSSGNKIKISFKLKPFTQFQLDYKSIQILEITSSSCDEGWVGLPDSTGCVLLVETLRSWASAEEDCQAKGGHLVTVRNDFVQRKLQELILGR